MAERRNSSTELLLAAVTAGVLAVTGMAWREGAMETIAGLRQRSALASEDVPLRGRLVRKLVEAGRTEEAMDLLRQRVENHPEDGFARRSFVELLAENGRTAEAVDVLHRWLQGHGDDLSSRERLADLLVTANQADEAQMLYRQVMAQSPGSVTAPYGLAKTYVLKRDDLNAQRTLEESLKKHPDDPPTNELLADLAVKSLGELAYPAAQKYYERAVKGDPARSDAALGLAKIYVSQGRYSDAAKVLVQPAAVDRKNAELHILYADILAEMHRYAPAVVEYSAGTAHDLENAEAYYRWGKMLVASGSPGAAETVLRRALEINEAQSPRTPELKRRCAEYHLQLARALRDQGISIAAFMKEFETAIDCDPSYVDTYVEVAQTYLDAHQEGTAEKWLKDALNVAPTSTLAKVQLARIYMNPQEPSRKNMDAAIALLAESVSETHSQDVSLLVGLANALASVHRYEDALIQMDAALPAGRAAHLPAWQMELLASMRQDYFLALLPPLTEGEGRFGIDGRVVHEVWDDPLPPPLQPSLIELSKRPMNLSQPPSPANALDPALYMGAALQKPETGEFNGMPVLDILK